MITLDQVRAAHAGHTFSAFGRPATVLPDFDFETFSMAGFVWNADKNSWDAPPGIGPQKKGLRCLDAFSYAEHPSFEWLALAYDLKDGRGPRRWRYGEPLPQELIDYIARGGIIEAHNAGFERRAWNSYARRYGLPPLAIEQQRCSQAKARAIGLPPSLAKAAEVLGTTPKDAGGTTLINLFSMPVKPTKKRPATRVYPHDEPARFNEFCDYNQTDIEAEAHLSANTPDLSPQEQAYWVLDQRINDRGVAIDLETVDRMADILRQAESRYSDRFRALTGGLDPTQLEKFKGWCLALGFPMTDMTEESVADALKNRNPPPLVRETLEIRAALGSASVKKVHAIRARVASNGRLHDLFNFHAAHTGRPTGDGPQPTNLPRSGPDVWLCQCGRHYGHMRPFCAWCGAGPEGRRKRVKGGGVRPLVAGDKPDEWNPTAMQDAIVVTGAGSLSLLELFYGEALTTIGGCLRGVFVAGQGHDLISSDYTSIEAVVLACLAGEQWRIDLFKEGGKIYEKSGALVTGLKYEDLLAYSVANGAHHPARQIGKTAELALGYGGWIAAWRNFDDNPNTSDDEIKGHILNWRKVSPAIVEFWGGQSRRNGRSLIWERFGVEGAFIDCILNPGRTVEFRGFKFDCLLNPVTNQNTVTITLLSGRLITYHNVTLSRSDRYGSEYSIQYWRWNTNPTNGRVNAWIAVYTHGGKLVENIVQAVSNDILRSATKACEAGGYPVVLHVYDEITAEIPHGFGSIKELENLMTIPQPWAVLPNGEPWPIKAAGGWRGLRYRKG